MRSFRFLILVFVSFLPITAFSQRPFKPISGPITIVGEMGGMGGNSDSQTSEVRFYIEVKVKGVRYDCRFTGAHMTRLFGKSFNKFEDLHSLSGKRLKVTLTNVIYYPAYVEKNGIVNGVPGPISLWEYYGGDIFSIKILGDIVRNGPKANVNNTKTIRGVVTGALCCNCVNPDDCLYTIVVKVGRMKYWGAVSSKRHSSVFGTVITNANQLRYLYDKRIEMTLRNVDQVTSTTTNGDLVSFVVLGDTSTNTRRNITPRKNSPNPRLPLPQQAIAAVKNYFEGYFTKCGDSYVSKLENVIDQIGIYQYKSGSFVLSRTRQLTEADRLNGIEWSGVVIFPYSGSRAYLMTSSRRGWTQWKNGSDIAFYATKTRNGWQVECFNDLKFRSHRKISCSDIPN